MLAELYFSKNHYEDALNTVDSYTKKEPNDPSGFSFKAKVLLYQNYFKPNALLSILPDNNIHISLCPLTQR